MSKEFNPIMLDEMGCVRHFQYFSVVKGETVCMVYGSGLFKASKETVAKYTEGAKA